jgi:hypothetical protein
MRRQSTRYRHAFETYDRALLVDRLRGTLPVLLACPHDGTVQPEGVRARKREHFPAGAILSHPATSMSPT